MHGVDGNGRRNVPLPDDLFNTNKVNTRNNAVKWDDGDLKKSNTAHSAQPPANVPGLRKGAWYPGVNAARSQEERSLRKPQ